MQNSKDTITSLRSIVRELDPSDQYCSAEQLVDSMEKNKVLKRMFKKTFQHITKVEIDQLEHSLENIDDMIIGAADYLGILSSPEVRLQEKDILSESDPKRLQQMLRSCCIFNDAAAISILAKKIDVNLLDHNEQSALMYAVGNNATESVDVLLRCGADPNLQGGDGMTALHVCATSVSSKKIFKMLLSAGGDLKVRDENGETVMDALKLLRRSGWVTNQ